MGDGGKLDSRLRGNDGMGGWGARRDSRTSSSGNFHSSFRTRHSSFIPCVCVWSAATLVTAVFLCIVLSLVWHGIAAVSWSFLTAAPINAGRAGGIGPILVSTAMILAVCLAVSVPIGVGTAMLLAEFTSTESLLGCIVRRSLDALAGVPSIVFGLFGSVFFCKTLGLGFSILSGGLTLACMVLPILVRSTEEGFRSVPHSYRLAAASLGFTRTSTMLHLVVPLAIPGIVVGLVLSIGRAIAETAALIFTSGYVDRMPGSWLDSGRSLSIHIYDLSMNVPGGNRNAYGSALVLVVLLFAINTLASWLTRRPFGKRIIS